MFYIHQQKEYVGAPQLPHIAEPLVTRLSLAGMNHLTGEHLRLAEYKLHGGIGRNDVLAMATPPSSHQIIKFLYQFLNLAPYVLVHTHLLYVVQYFYTFHMSIL